MYVRAVAAAVTVTAAIVSAAVRRPAPEQAASADAFVNTISVQTHIGYPGIYQTKWDEVRFRLLDLGVRHIRERMYENATVVQRTRDLAANGVRLTAGCWPKDSDYTHAAHCLTQADAYGVETIEAFDGWNEVDGQPVTLWPTKYRQWQ